jgi:hypothetical protein
VSPTNLPCVERPAADIELSDIRAHIKIEVAFTTEDGSRTYPSMPVEGVPGVYQVRMDGEVVMYRVDVPAVHQIVQGEWAGDSA